MHGRRKLAHLARRRLGPCPPWRVIASLRETNIGSSLLMSMVTCDVRAKGCAELASENILPPAQPSASCWVIVLHPEARATRSKMGKRMRQFRRSNWVCPLLWERLRLPAKQRACWRRRPGCTRLHDVSLALDRGFGDSADPASRLPSLAEVRKQVVTRKTADSTPAGTRPRGTNKRIF